jgi:hypothetical protein
MGELGIAGVVRGKTTRTTIHDEHAPRPADLVAASSTRPVRTNSGLPI